MVWLLVLIALTALLIRFYPIAVAHWLLSAADRAEKRHQEEVDRYLQELHDKIVEMKAHLDASRLDDEMRHYLQEMCDDFERDLRYDVLNSE